MGWATFCGIFFTNSSGHPERMELFAKGHFLPEYTEKRHNLATFQRLFSAK
jgi:hypothetical protein